MKNSLIHRITVVRMRRRLEEHRAQRLCTGCGIDLPTAWHWDDCVVDREVKAARA